MSKVYDGFIINDEYDMLELRLEILYDYVDEFMIVESDWTFSNKYKGHNLEKHLSRYDRWMDKITYLKVNSNKHANPWQNEHDQHRHIVNSLWTKSKPDDILLAAINIDEIIRPEAIEYMKNTPYTFYNLIMPMFYFKFNYVDAQPGNFHYKVWAKAVKGYTGTEVVSPLAQLIARPGDKEITLHHAGWHFSMMGDEESNKRKIQSYSHTELDRPDILNNIDIDKHIERGEDHLQRGFNKWKKVKLDEYFPKAILNQKEKYRKLILPDGLLSVQKYFPFDILEKV